MKNLLSDIPIIGVQNLARYCPRVGVKVCPRNVFYISRSTCLNVLLFFTLEGIRSSWCFLRELTQTGKLGSRYESGLICRNKYMCTKMWVFYSCFSLYWASIILPLEYRFLLSTLSTMWPRSFLVQPASPPASQFSRSFAIRSPLGDSWRRRKNIPLCSVLDSGLSSTSISNQQESSESFIAFFFYHRAFEVFQAVESLWHIQLGPAGNILSSIYCTYILYSMLKPLPKTWIHVL
jgi:hypothetical protein